MNLNRANDDNSRVNYAIILGSMYSSSPQNYEEGETPLTIGTAGAPFATFYYSWSKNISYANWSLSSTVFIPPAGRLLNHLGVLTSRASDIGINDQCQDLFGKGFTDATCPSNQNADTVKKLAMA
eukprot:scaffold19_cov114-Cylindrotheca_fusiformis.AAC.18